MNKLKNKKESKESTHCCKKCVHCFDEYQHFSYFTFSPPPPRINKRFYCNYLHKYVLPGTVRRCFKKW